MPLPASSRGTLRRVVVVGMAVLLAVMSPATLASAVGRGQTPSSGLPADTKADGYVGLCDASGHNVVGGNINTKPFVWKAVASVAAPAGYSGAGQNAVLNVYQPRPQTQPAYWSGSSLTSASFYTSTRTPTVQATNADSSLADFMAAFPPEVNGLYVLRIFWGKRDYGTTSSTYPATTIQVRGSQWHVVSGGTVDCAAAKATSFEQLTGVATKADLTPRTPAGDQTTTANGTPRRIANTPAAVSSSLAAGSHKAAAGSVAAASNPSSAAESSTSSHTWLLWSLAAVVVLLAAALGLVLRRRSLPVSTSSSADQQQRTDS